MFESKEATCYKQAPRLGKKLPIEKLKPSSRILKRKITTEKRENRRKEKQVEESKKKALAEEKKIKKAQEEEEKKSKKEKRPPNYIYPSSTKNYYVPVSQRPGYAEKKADKMRLREEKRQQKIKEYLERKEEMK